MNQQSLQLHEALTTFNVKKVISLIRDGVDINIPDQENGMTPLMKAIFLNSVETIQVILQSGADLYKQDYQERTPLALAVQLGHLEVVEQLLKVGAKVNVSGCEPPLYLAIGSNNIQVIKALINAGADVNCGVEDNYTALMRAAQLGHIEAVKLLIDAGADISIVNKDGGTALLIVAEVGEQEIFEYLYSLTSSPKEREYASKRLLTGIRRKQRREDKLTSNFIKAVQLSDLNAVRAMIANRVNIDALSEEGETALHIAASHGNLEMIHIFLQAGASCEIRDEFNGWTPLMKAVSCFQQEAVKTLINAGSDVNARTKHDELTTLILAVDYHPVRNFSFKHPKTDQSIKTIQTLIEAGIDLEAKDKFGNTALMIATTKDAFEVVEILKEAGASQTGLERIALLKAAQKGDTERVRSLLDAGVNINVTNYSGETALILASRQGHIDTVQFLIEAGADININNSGTALIAATDSGHLEIVKILIQSGADMNIENLQTGWKAIDYARDMYPEIVEFLKKKHF